ncbi:protein WVD2-like 2 isoform X2 [Salvia miltiorrhiza]|uniref:protein WVD2-like 2 isoform X2 n=1 Tax=Salvia miltiorrhiza TaxID=226208 RepID=UPI0025AC57C5|nr:protein WVD2-like 2 isoform X2 [Salvia miltiorrhiza]
MSTKSQDDEVCEEEDTSSAASARTNKFKVTVPVAPKFICEERLEKRREYYAKLDEKHKALEKEKQEAEARQKEEEAAAIKELRKSMVYRANPVPSFYHEGPPPKLPLTRPKSPKITRRRSCGDAGKACCGEVRANERAARARGKERIPGGRRSHDNSKAIKDDPQVQEHADYEDE